MSAIFEYLWKLTLISSWKLGGSFPPSINLSDLVIFIHALWSWIFTFNREFIGWEFFIYKDWTIDVVVLGVEFMYSGWIIPEEVFFDVFWINVLGIWLHLAVLSEKVANDNRKSNPYN